MCERAKILLIICPTQTLVSCALTNHLGTSGTLCPGLPRRVSPQESRTCRSGNRCNWVGLRNYCMISYLKHACGSCASRVDTIRISSSPCCPSSRCNPSTEGTEFFDHLSPPHTGQSARELSVSQRGSFYRYLEQWTLQSWWWV